MMRILEEAGTGFALPVQLHPPETFGFDESKARLAEEEAAAWRKAGRSPFPDFTPEDVKKVEGTLDYPPEGSPDYRPPGLAKPKHASQARLGIVQISGARVHHRN